VDLSGCSPIVSSPEKTKKILDQTFKKTKNKPTNPQPKPVKVLNESLKCKDRQQSGYVRLPVQRCHFYTYLNLDIDTLLTYS